MMSLSSISRFFSGLYAVVTGAVSSLCSRVTTVASGVFSQINKTVTAKSRVIATQQPTLLDPKDTGPQRAFVTKYMLEIQRGTSPERALEMARAEAFAARYSAAIEDGLSAKKALQEATAVMEAGFTQAEIFETAIQMGATDIQATAAAKAAETFQVKP